MNQSKNAIGNLIARYKAILEQCSVINTFGSLATATALTGAVVLGGASAALADEIIVDGSMYSISGDTTTLTISTDGTYASGVDLSDTFGDEDIPVIFGASLDGSTSVSNVVMDLTKGTYNGIIFGAGFVNGTGNSLNLDSAKATVASDVIFAEESEISGGVFAFDGASSTIGTTTLTYLTTPQADEDDWFGITGGSQAIATISGSEGNVTTTSVSVGTTNVTVGTTGLTADSDSGAVSIDGGGCAIAEIFTDDDTLSYVTSTTSTTTTNITINDSASVASIVGGDRAELEGYVGNTYSNITILAETGTTNITINGGQFYEEIIAGGIANYEIDSDDDDDVYPVSSDNSDITITSTVGTTNLTINGGTFQGWTEGTDEDDNIYPISISGGGYAEGEFTKATVNEANITILGGTFGDEVSIYAGGIAEDGGTSTVTTANLTISNGTFGEWTNIVGGGYAYYATSEVTTANIIISGGTFGASTSIYGGGIAVYEGTSTVNETNITISGGTFGEGTTIYAGGVVWGYLDDVNVANTTITVGTATITFTGEAGNEDNNTETASLADGYNGIGIDGSGADEAILAFVDYTGEFKAGVGNIETLAVDGTSNVYVDGGTASQPNVAFADDAGDFNVLNIAEGGTLRIGDADDTFTGALSVTDTIVTLTSADIAGDVLFTETANNDVATSLTVNGDVVVDGSFTNNGATIIVGVGDGVASDPDEFDGYDSILVVDSLSNTGTVTINSDAKIIVKEGLTLTTDGEYVLNGGEAIILGSGLDLTAVTVAGDATFALGNDEAKITTTTVTLADGVEDIIFNQGDILILGDGAGGAFINNSGDLTIDGDAWLNLGSEFIGAGAQQYTPEYADYNQGGTYEGTISVTADAGLSVDNGNWTVGAVEIAGEASIGGYGVAASLITTDSFTVSGTLEIEADGMLDASTGSFVVEESATVTIESTGTLIIDSVAVGYDTAIDDEGVVSIITDDVTATISTGANVTNAGFVQITGLDGATIDYGDDYADMIAAVKTYITDDGTGTFIFADLTIDTTNTTLGTVAGNNDTTLANNTVIAGEVNVDQTAVVAGVTGGGTTTIADRGTLTLTGNTDDGILAVGAIENSGTLFLGSEGVVATMSSTLTNSGETTTLGQVSFGDVNNSGEFYVEGTTIIEQLTASSDDAVIYVGNNSTSGSLIANAKLDGSTIFLDPAWVDGDEITDASKAALSFESAIVDGYVIIGENSYVVLGDGTADELTTAAAIFEAYGLTWGSESDGDILAALFINEAYTVDDTSGGIYVDGSLNAVCETSEGTATFASDSLLAVNADNIASGTAALTATSIEVEEGASLLIISNGEATVTIAEATTLTFNNDSEGSAWGYNDDGTVDTSTIYVNSLLMEVASVDLTDTTYSVTVSKLSEEAVAGVYGNYMDSGLSSHLANYNNGGNAFLDEALDPALGAKKSAKAIEGATKTAVASGVGASLGHIGSASAANIEARVGAATAFNDKDTSKMLAMSGDGSILPMDKAQEGFGIWFMPMYKHTEASGFESGKYDYGYNTDLYGASLGADYTFASSLRLGLAFNVGSGQTDSTGDFDSTENDFDYFGLTAYASMTSGKLAVLADIGYTASSNDITQSNTAGHLTADADADLFSIGLKGQYAIGLDGFNVTPYAGMRMNYYSIDSFNTKYQGSTTVRTASEEYIIAEFPIGLTFDTTMVADGWDITPKLSLGVKFAAGDLDLDQEVSYVGADGSAVLSSEIADVVTFQGGLGLGMSKDAYSLSLGYTLDWSENVQSHGVNLNLRYEF